MIRKTIEASVGETLRIKNEWAAECEARGTTVTASVWEASSGAASGETLSANLATVLLAVDGDGVLTNTVTLANGEVLLAERSIRVA